MALKIPLTWLNAWTALANNPQEIAEGLTLAGLEVESVEQIGPHWTADTYRVGQIASVSAHPNADQLCLVEIDYSQETDASPQRLTLVTGAPNLFHYIKHPLPNQPLKVPVALVGAQYHDAYQPHHPLKKLKASNIRGVRSEGMICSELELGIGMAHEGILLLPSDAPRGATLTDYLGDSVFEFDIKGGFGHLHSVRGIAREAAAIFNAPFDSTPLDQALAACPQGQSETDFVSIQISNPELCPRYSAVLVKGIQIVPSPFWLQQRLLKVGVRPINAVVDTTNYVMMELGQPLHAFDYHTLQTQPGHKKPAIVVRTAHDGEKMSTLDSVERTFDSQMLLITDGIRPLGIGGIMGGADSEISEQTSTVLIEAANFSFLNIRRSAQLLKLRSEAGDRFGKGLSPDLCLAAGMRCAQLIVELCGGEIHPQAADLYPHPFTPPHITLPLSIVEKTLGIAIEPARIKQLLQALQFQVESNDPLTVTPPADRLDINMQADVIEEIGRIYGYNALPLTTLAGSPPALELNNTLDDEERIRDLLCACGLDETITYSQVAQNEAKWLMPSAAQHEANETEEEPMLTLINPLSAEKAVMRRRLLAENLHVLSRNASFHNKVQLFEMGRVFHPKQSPEQSQSKQNQSEKAAQDSSQEDSALQLLPNEHLQLCAIMCGLRDSAFWQDDPQAQPESLDFSDIKGVAEALFNGLGLSDVQFMSIGSVSELLSPAFGLGQHAHLSYHPGRAACILKNKQLLGYVGELHPAIPPRFKVSSSPVCVLELDLQALLPHALAIRSIRSISQHPPVYEDLAFVVDETLEAQHIYNLIWKSGQPLLQALHLFDVYQGPNLPAGKKSLAYGLTYQAHDHTLKEKEIAEVRKKIVRQLEKQLHAELRGSIE